MLERLQLQKRVTSRDSVKQNVEDLLSRKKTVKHQISKHLSSEISQNFQTTAKQIADKLFSSKKAAKQLTKITRLLQICLADFQKSAEQIAKDLLSRFV